MKAKNYFILIFLFSINTLYCQLETKAFVLNKDDYNLLEEKNLLVSEAIINAFGESTKQNSYKIEIDQVDAWNSRIKEFKYFPNANDDSKDQLKSKALKYVDNYNIELRVKVNKSKSVITDAIKPYLDKKNCFILSLTIIGNPKVFVTEVRNTEKFKEMVAEKSFAVKAFKKRFGEEQKNNYHIAFENIHACIMKDLYDPKCIEEHELLASSEAYEKFSQKITLEEYKGAYILFTVPLLRKQSKLIPTVENYVMKEADGNEILKFYFCIPQEPGSVHNTKPALAKANTPKAGIVGSIKGKLLDVNSKSELIKNETVELKNSDNAIVQTMKTDEQGTFEFKDIDLESSYMIYLPNYTSVDKNSKVYVANLSGELIKELSKDVNSKFAYKTIDADVFRLNTMNENDVELTFSRQKIANKSPIVIQDFVYYDLNSYKISPESKSTLDKIIKLLNENTNYTLEIISHTDSRGEDEENLTLSQKRSESVLNYLLSNSKLDSKRIKPLGMGESSPLNSCLNGRTCMENEFKMNRRTEFVFKRT